MKLRSLLAATAIGGLAISPIQAAAIDGVRTATPVQGENLAGVSDSVLVLAFIAAIVGLVVVANTDDDDEDLPVSP